MFPLKFSFSILRSVLTFLLITQLYHFANAQQPPYHYSNKSGSPHAFPLYSGNNKVQWIYEPNAFKAGGSSSTYCPAGVIDTIYFKIGSNIGSPNIFSDFTVKLAQNIGTDTSWTNVNWNKGMQTVYHKDPDTLYHIKGDWVAIPLQTSFNYDPSKSLVFELSVSSGKGLLVESLNGNSDRQIWGTYNATKGAGKGTGLVRFGLSVSSIPANNAGVKELVSPQSRCEGNYGVLVSLANNGTTPLDSVNVFWAIDDTLRGSFSHTEPIGIQGNPLGNLDTVFLGYENLIFGNPRELKVWVANPNGLKDSLPQDDTLTTILHPALNGKYTIGGNGADYNNIASACNDLNTYGVCGPVEFLLDSGTYNERILIQNVKGVSAQNYIQFYGKNKQECVIKNNANDSFGDWQNILILQTDFVRIKDLSIFVEDTMFGVGVHMVASNNVEVQNLNIQLPKGKFSTFLLGVLGSGDRYSISSGYSGNNNSIKDIEITGGYCGVYYIGASSINMSDSLIVEGLTIKDYLRYGIYLIAINQAKIYNNNLQSQLNADVNGMRLEALNNFTCSRNRIFSVYEGIYISFNNYFSHPGANMSILSNNMISTTGTWAPALYNEFGRDLKIYHNSFRSHSQFCVQFKEVDSTDFVNNIIDFRTNGVPVYIGKNCQFYSTKYRIDYNVYYAPSSLVQVYHDPIGYSKFSDWFGAHTYLNNNSFVQDPGFIDSSDLHLKSQSPPTGLDVRVEMDFDGKPRCMNAPTIGAEEILQGSFPDPKNPTFICVLDTLKIPLSPPKGMKGFPYDSLWNMGDWSITGKDSSIPISFTFITPNTSHNGYFQFIPQPQEANTSWELSCKLIDKRNNGCYESFGVFIQVEDSVNAGFTLSDSGFCLGQKLEVKAVSKGSLAKSYSYNFGNGAIRNGADVEYVYPLPGNYTLTQIAKNQSCIDTAQISFQVGGVKGVAIDSNESQNISINSGKPYDPDVLCLNDSLLYVFTHPTGYDNSTYNKNWEVSELKLIGVGSQSKSKLLVKFPSVSNALSITVVDTGQQVGDTLLIQLKINSLGSGSCTKLIERYIVIGGGPKVGFSFGTTCKLSAVQFVDSTNKNSKYLYYWDFGDGNSSTQSNPRHTYKDSGDFSLVFRVRDEFHCWGERKHVLRVNPLPEVSFVSQGDCSNRPWTFTNKTNATDSIDSYKWNFGDGNTSSLTHPIHTYALDGEYMVKLVATTNNNCVDSSDLVVKVLQTPISSFDADTVCEGFLTHFKSHSPDSTTGNYFWKFDNKTSSTGIETTHMFEKGGSIYDVMHKVTDLSGKCSDSTTQKIKVAEKPSADFTISYGLSRQVTLTPNDTNYNLLWFFGDGDSSYVKVPTHTFPKDSNTFWVRLKVENIEGCQDEKGRWVDFTDLSILNQVSDKFKVWPNPVNASALLKLKLSDLNAKVHHIDLCDVLGRSVDVAFVKIEDGSYVLKPSEYHLGSGLYFLSIHVEEEQWIKKIWIVE